MGSETSRQWADGAWPMAVLLAISLASGCVHLRAPVVASPAATPAAAEEEPALPEPPDAGVGRQPEDTPPVADAGPPVPQWPSPAQALLELTRPDEHTEDVVLGGAHLRFGTGRGPVHVWRPEGYDPLTAGTVLYLHGYFNSVDSAWDEHRLAEQFAASGMNALFIVPEAPSGRADDVFWKDLAELLRVVRGRAKLKLPRGPLVVVGHSGAYRTLVTWLDEPRLRAIILIDGLYGYDAEFAGWLRGTRRRAVLVAADTAGRTEVFLRRFPRATRLDELPETLDELTPEQRSARILYVPTTRFDHMGLVTAGKVVPLMLGLAPLTPLQPATTSR